MISQVFNLSKLQCNNVYFTSRVNITVWGKTLATKLTAHYELFQGELKPKKGVFLLPKKSFKDFMFENELNHLISQDDKMKALVRVEFEDPTDGFEREQLLWIENGKIYRLPATMSEMNLNSLYPWIKDE
jgi:hypothetical protein